LIETVYLLFLTFLFVFIGVYGAFLGYVALSARKPWGLKIDGTFEPNISILVPVHNEERIIESKLANIKNVSYPRQKMEIIVADDASDDQTLLIAENFVKNNPELSIKIVKQVKHEGKSAALNKALLSTTNNIVIVTDADTTWQTDLLKKSMPYLSDSKIGAITCRGVNTNSDQSWITKAEKSYLGFANLIRLGESKAYSTIKFEGGFCAYKKGTFDEFDRETGADDSGTALKVIQNNYRTILIPEVLFYTTFPTHFRGKMKTKIRRATQLMSLWLKCLGLLTKRRLLLPKKIAIPEILLFVFVPWVFVALAATTVAMIILFPFSDFSIAVLVLIIGMLVLARNIFFEVVIDNFILSIASINLLFGKRYVAWGKA
jgi:cellulose synthase/poly-beta-1,6-N-acetylglucosamine synthase-like glycosyltransferase